MVTSDGGSRRTDIYAGSANRPSLDEVVQEGIVGLAVAAERYEPKKGFRFSTYATFWIKNSVRIVFQKAVTGVIKVSPSYHDIVVRSLVWAAVLCMWFSFLFLLN